jgi:hypothetical protein
MNLGQTLLTILALVLFATITATINRTRIFATMLTIEHQHELEAVSYGQTLIEVLSNIANTESGYDDLEARVNDSNAIWNDPYTTDSGNILYSDVAVHTGTITVSSNNHEYKKVTVSIYSDSSKSDEFLKSRYITAFSKWW